MRLKATLYERPDWEYRRPEGSLEWDSETGRLGGTLASRVARRIEEAQHNGGIALGPMGEHLFATPDPLHDPVQMAVVLDVMGFILKHPAVAELARYYPQLPPPRATPGVQ